jgi:hypothetical protein
MLEDGVAFAGFWLLTPKCSSCGAGLEPVPGYGDFLRGSKLHCPNRCHPENYRNIDGVRA